MIQEEQMVHGVRYIHKSDHRDGTNIKSRWIISKADEINCFEGAFLNTKQQSLSDRWGLHIDNHKVVYLGKVAEQYKDKKDETTYLFIAFFEHDQPNNYWHGYPADVKRSIKDIPPTIVRNDWLQQKLLSAATISKIARRVRCKL